MVKGMGANLIVTLLEFSRAPVTVKEIMGTKTKSPKLKQMPEPLSNIMTQLTKFCKQNTCFVYLMVP